MTRRILLRVGVAPLSSATRRKSVLKAMKETRGDLHHPQYFFFSIFTYMCVCVCTRAFPCGFPLREPEDCSWCVICPRYGAWYVETPELCKFAPIPIPLPFSLSLSLESRRPRLFCVFLPPSSDHLRVYPSPINKKKLQSFSGGLRESPTSFFLTPTSLYPRKPFLCSTWPTGLSNLLAFFRPTKWFHAVYILSWGLGRYAQIASS